MSVGARPQPVATGSMMPRRSRMPQRRLGVLYCATAFAIWGLLPLYLKALTGVSAFEVLLHRVLWLLPFLIALLAIRRDFGWVRAAFSSGETMRRFAGSAFLLSINWFLYIWAVSSERVVDASLGYFINPLVSVVLGVAVLGEHLRRAQWIAIAIAAAGVLWLTVLARQLPWIGLVLAASFGGYGLLRKTAPLGALEGLAIETCLMFPLALAGLVFLGRTNQSAFVAAGAGLEFLLALAGPITGVPLLLFAAGARRIPLSLVGLLQYIGPTLQLLLGIFVWHEPFRVEKFAGYALIWLALALYTLEGFARTARRKPA